MAKRIERDGKFYRIRRGKEVEIPILWVGRVYKNPGPEKRDSAKWTPAKHLARRRARLYKEELQEMREEVDEIQNDDSL